MAIVSQSIYGMLSITSIVSPFCSVSIPDPLADRIDTFIVIIESIVPGLAAHGVATGAAAERVVVASADPSESSPLPPKRKFARPLLTSVSFSGLP